MNIAKVVNRVGTWNVCSLNIAGKLAIVEKKMKRYGCQLFVGISTPTLRQVKKTSIFLSGNDSNRSVLVMVDRRYI